MDGFIGFLLFIGVIVAIVLIRGNITRKANEARAERERVAASNFLRATPLPQSLTPPAIGSRYAVDDPPPPPPPGA